MNATKIHLSADELTLMQNSEWILTKNNIIEKVRLQFGRLSQLMQNEMNRHPFPEDNVMWKEPKISRGEKYMGLPYVMLDYPRIFEKEHILAIRTFFWWGNFYSMTLHVKGRFMAPVLQNLFNIPAAGSRMLYLSTTGDEWNHNINSAHYTLLSDRNAWKGIQESLTPDFIKISLKVNFSQWNEMENVLAGCFPVLLQMAGI